MALHSINTNTNAIGSRTISKNVHQKYSHSTLSKFDIIGSYFVNLYYNEFYIKAKNLKNQGNYNNTTDAYKNLLSSYVDFSKQHDFFKQIVKGIHTYCISTTRYTTMSHKECIDFMVSEFVPENLWNSLREQQKNKLFHESLINCIKEFTEKIILNHLHIIIDNHDNDENIIILQDLFLNIILLEKDKIFSKFINPNVSTINIFKTKIQEIINEKKKINDNNLLLQRKNQVLENLNKKNSTIIIELQKKNKLLIDENIQLKKNEIVLNKKISQYIDIIRLNQTMNKNKIYENNVDSNTNLIKEKKKSNNESISNNKISNDVIKNIKSDNEFVDGKSIDNEFVDDKIIDNKIIDNKIINNETIDNEFINNKSIDNESIDNESIDNESVDDEFESYFNTSNIPIVRDLVFEKNNEEEYY